MSLFIIKINSQQHFVDGYSQYFFPIYDLLHIKIFYQLFALDFLV